MGRSYVYLNREPNLPCSAKSGLLLTLSDGVIDVRHDGRLINVSINWESWLYDQFKVPSGQFRPVVGAYNASGELWHDSASMLVGYHGRPGRFAIDAVTYGPEGWIDAVTMRFEQPCGYGVDPYRGKIHWNRLERPIFPTAPPAPSWQPPEKLPPPNVSALYLEHTPGRYGGPTGTSLEASADVTMQVRHWEGRIGFSAWDRAGSHWTHAEFVLPARFTKAFAGHFPDLRRAGGIHNPVKGGVDFGRHGSGCNTLEGWFAIDEISFYDDLVDSMTVRFEVDCGFVTRGKLQWKRAAYRSADEATLPFYPLGVPSLGAVS